MKKVLFILTEKSTGDTIKIFSGSMYCSNSSFSIIILKISCSPKQFLFNYMYIYTAKFFLSIPIPRTKK